MRFLFSILELNHSLAGACYQKTVCLAIQHSIDEASAATGHTRKEESVVNPLQRHIHPLEIPVAFRPAFVCHCSLRRMPPVPGSLTASQCDSLRKFGVSLHKALTEVDFLLLRTDAVSDTHTQILED